jgi:hypothetical protein
MPNESSINELSSVIGELRHSAAQQYAINSQVLDELRKISDRMAIFSEASATFVEYRKTLHERFGKIHEQIADIDLWHEQFETRIRIIEQFHIGFKANWKLGIGMLYFMTSVTAAIVSAYGSGVFHALFH